MGTVFAIFSPTGGVGVSTIAAHLGYFLAAQRESAIVDLIPDFGSIIDFVEFDPQPSSQKFPLLFDKTSQLLQEHTHPKREHLKIFAVPPSLIPQQIDWKAFFASARKSFEHVILDLPHSFIAPELSIGLANADQIICVGEYHWATIQSLKAFFDGCDTSFLEKCKVLINRYDILPEAVLKQCRDNLGREVLAELPFDPPLEGTRRLRENSAFGKSIKKLAGDLSPMTVS